MDIFWTIIEGYLVLVGYSFGVALIALTLLICGTFIFFWLKRPHCIYCNHTKFDLSAGGPSRCVRCGTPIREPDSAYKRMKNSPAGGFIDESLKKEE